MKKMLVFTLVVAMLLSTFLTGCSNNEPATQPSSQDSNQSSNQPTDSGASKEETNWPKETVTMVVPYGAGGDTDTYARQLSDLLTKELGANFIVVNTTGGAGVIASSSVLTAKPDGYTALFHHTGVMLTQEAAKTNEFSFIDDFEVVGTAARDDTYALIAKADSKWTSLEDMIAWAKENPGKLRYSVTYYGATHAVATLLESAMGIELNQIDVGSGTSERLTAFMADQVDVLVVNFMNIADYVENGDFVVLGICAEERPAGLEEFPTLKEQGYDVVQSKIYEVRLPKNTDKAIVDKFSEAIEKVVSTDEFKNILATYYAEPYYRDAATTISEDLSETEHLKEMFKDN